MRLGAQVATLTVGTLAAVGIVYLPGNDAEPATPETSFIPAAEVFATADATIPPEASTTPLEAPTTTAALVLATTTSAPSTTTTLVPDSALCGMWWVTATVAGWNVADLPTLDRVLYNESRCISGLESSTGDVGLAQLNVATWAHLWERDGHTTDDVATNPVLNLFYARRVADLAEHHYDCAWAPWNGYSGDYGC